MTTARTGRTLPVGYRDHTIVGTPVGIANVLANHVNTGTLLLVSVPRPATTDPNDPRVCVRVRLRTTTTTTTPAATRLGTPRIGTRRTRRIIVWTVTAVSVTAGIGAVMAYLLGLLVAFVAAHTAEIIGVLTLIAVAAGLLARGSSDRKRHCPGC